MTASLASRAACRFAWPLALLFAACTPPDELQGVAEPPSEWGALDISRFGYHPRDWEWKSKGLANSQWGCKRGWVVLDEISIGLPSAQEWHGGTDVLVGARLGRLADGSLAVGQWMRVTGRTGSIGWGDTVFFTTRSGDRVAWHWQRLERVGASGEGVPPPPAGPIPPSGSGIPMPATGTLKPV